MLAQSLGAYGLLAGAADGLTRMSVWAHAWIDDWGPFVVAAGGLFVAGRVLLKLLART